MPTLQSTRDRAVSPESVLLRQAHLSRDPMPVPYLERPPTVIPVDVGRQLFVDDYLVDSTTLGRVYHKAVAHAGNPVISPDQQWERKQHEAKDPPQTIPFSDGCWYDPRDHYFKLWYAAGWHQSTCLAVSRDGLQWQKPTRDVVARTNIVHPGTRDSATIWLNDATTSRSRRFTMMRRDNDSERHLIHYSSDGVHWSEPGLPVGNAYDRSTFFYNPFRQVWVLSLRSDSVWLQRETYDPDIKTRKIDGPLAMVPRFRRYREGPTLIDAAQSWPYRQSSLDQPASTEHWHDPTIWTWADRLDLPRADIGATPELYNLDAVAYESVMLGLFSIWRGVPQNYPARDKICDICLGFSRDGFHWHRPFRQPVIDVDEDPDAWNHSNVQSVGGCCLIVGDELYLYASGRQVRDIRERHGCSSTGLFKMRRDGFASMTAGSQPGELLTRPLLFSGSHLFVNVQAAKGDLAVEVLDETGHVVEPYAMRSCVVVRTDSTKHMVRWATTDDLSACRGRPVRLRFRLREASLYAFWISNDVTGASGGYAAAGSPDQSG